MITCIICIGRQSAAIGNLKAVWPDFFGCISEVWPAPGAREGLQKGGGLRPPHFWGFSRALGAGQTSKTHPKTRPDCLQVSRFKNPPSLTPKSSILGVQAAPPHPKDHRKDGGRRPPPFRWLLERGGAVWIPKLNDFWVRVGEEWFFIGFPNYFHGRRI